MEGDQVLAMHLQLVEAFYEVPGEDVFDLDDLIENQEVYNKLTGQEREDFDLHLSALTYVLDVPLFAFSNAEFTYEIAEKVVKFLQKTYDDAISQPLQEETVQEDQEFKDAVLGLEEVKEALKEENS